MTEHEIDDVVRLVFAAWGDPAQQQGPHQETREAIAALASQFLIDVHRMSVAMITIAQAMSKFKGMPIATEQPQPSHVPLAEDHQGHG